MVILWKMYKCFTSKFITYSKNFSKILVRLFFKGGFFLSSYYGRFKTLTQIICQKNHVTFAHSLSKYRQSFFWQICKVHTYIYTNIIKKSSFIPQWVMNIRMWNYTWIFHYINGVFCLSDFFLILQILSYYGNCFLSN